ncbi:MAG: hypothetical protein J0L51_03025 [Rhizobiales bacterium]|nr:hypothetical protein [Hyphomicrobiales bacterium]
MKKIALAALAAVVLTWLPAEAEAQSASNFCIGVYNKYKASRGPKAFVTGSDGSCWWGAGQRNIAAAQQFALNACRKNRRPGCRLVESAF